MRLDKIHPKMSIKRKIFTISSLLICSIGLIIQINEVSNNYFKFVTESKVSIVFHEFIYTPSLSACFSVSDIIKRDQIKEKLNIDLIKPVTDTDWEKYREQSENFTIATLFEFTPTTDEVR